MPNPNHLPIALALLISIFPLSCIEEVQQDQFDRSCSSVDDCALISEGYLCQQITGNDYDCLCGRGAINKADLPRYEEKKQTSCVDLTPFDLSAECFCMMFDWELECRDGICTAISSEWNPDAGVGEDI